MNRTFASFPIADFNYCKKQLLHWANNFDVCCFLDNNHYKFSPHDNECLVGAGVKASVSAQAGNAFEQLQDFYDSYNGWLFGHFSYDLKNELEALHSNHNDGIGFPDLYFFIPEVVVALNNNIMSIGSITMAPVDIYNQITGITDFNTGSNSPVNISSRFSKDQYIDTIRKLQHHIRRGDCYEINFCQEFYSAQSIISPLYVYTLLTDISPNPFAAFYKIKDKYLCCASPERYLKKKGNDIITQPIKGTMARYPGNDEKDSQNKNDLFFSSKERSENVMIVDLVRNDLSKICEEGSVKVSELYGIYSFPQVHQMISTVSGLVKQGIPLVEMIKATFPMGSMTGAPKKSVMELLEKYEKTRRGIFSGAVGYITPQGDFDFNVVIRSILYNRLNKYLCYQVGSGITFYSDPEKEYEECLIKAAAIKKVLG